MSISYTLIYSQLIANKNQDRLCLAVAQELEKEFGGWIAPNSR